MPVTPTFAGTVPTVGGSADTWGTTLNTGLGQIKVDVDALAAQGNASETLASDALPKAGGTMTGNITLADVGPNSPLDVGFRGLPTVSIDANRTFVATDSGKVIRCFGSTGRTFTIPANADVQYPVGTVIGLRNFQTAVLTIAPASGVTLALAGGGFTSATRSLASSGFATLIKEDTNIWFLSGTGVS